ncbi:MAG TPA: hypothetical protein VGI10_07740 [Polyangiaceae bacterium]|jgi:sugar phosphate isomerase/epimerase
MSRIQQKRGTNKKRTEKPVSSGIHRAAARAGIESAEPPLDWDEIVAKAAKHGPLYVELVQLAKRFKEAGDDVSVGAGLACFTLAGVAPHAHTAVEVLASTAHTLMGVSDSAFASRIKGEAVSP